MTIYFKKAGIAVAAILFVVSAHAFADDSDGGVHAAPNQGSSNSDDNSYNDEQPLKREQRHSGRRFHARDQDDEGEYPVSLSRPNAISLELGGRGLLYTINYDRSLSSSVGLGVGFESFSLWGDFNDADSVTITEIPIYVNYYFSPYSSRFFLTGGLDLVVASGSYTGSNYYGTGTGVQIGGGYEYRGEGGFLFRATLYANVSTALVPWAGLSFGAAF